MILRVELPVPPSLNNAYANRKGGGGRYPTKVHREWKITAGWWLKGAKLGKIVGPYKFTILLPLNLRGDVSNRIKLAEDLLVEHGITPDDQYAAIVISHRIEGVPPGKCLIIVEAVA